MVQTAAVFVGRRIPFIDSTVGSVSGDGYLLVLLGLYLVSLGLIIALTVLAFGPESLSTQKGIAFCLVSLVASWWAFGAVPTLQIYGGIAALAASIAIATGLAVYTTIWLMEAPV